MRRIVLAISLLGLAMMVQAEELHYVIKVTPTLTYIDAGQQAGAQKGDVYLLLREHEEHFDTLMDLDLPMEVHNERVPHAGGSPIAKLPAPIPEWQL